MRLPKQLEEVIRLTEAELVKEARLVLIEKRDGETNVRREVVVMSVSDDEVVLWLCDLSKTATLSVAQLIDRHSSTFYVNKTVWEVTTRGL